MAFHYPNGKRYVPAVAALTSRPVKKANYGNRGKSLEDDINDSNEYYLANGIAVIHKKPTPIQIVDVHYPKRSAAVIREAYFKQASTTDYNGVYKGKYVDFEAKETQNPTSFPLKNFHEHQIKHMVAVSQQGGISFVLLKFSAADEIYLMDSHHLTGFWERMLEGGRKSISKEEVEAHSSFIPLGFQPRIDYIKIIDGILTNK
ncbi:Holliday junction resolvase RecU [Bacillus sp. M6-12]|uniref:Holliday junction resolvase RecU n=1 Tax=Bacillus sp. M6-12 TaxID=2054166 RepID=UPI000C78AD4C|nr:Holliday junction resolvase RecU [Bacillus sp. M6-12]PLS16315.1 Holliday junction resolvase RecU [Bacillus sp. M6-12]